MKTGIGACRSIGILSCFLAVACSSNPKKVNYNDYDALIVPLPGAYELIKLNGRNTTWNMNLKNRPGSIQNIDSIGLIGSIILAHSPRTYARDTLEVASWFILDPISKTEQQFERITDYRASLRKLQLADTRHSIDFVKPFLQKSEPINWTTTK